MTGPSDEEKARGLLVHLACALLPEAANYTEVAIPIVAAALRAAREDGEKSALASAAERLAAIQGNPSEIRLHCGELSHAELRLVQAVIGWLANDIRALAPSREPEKTCRTCGASWSSDCAECAKSDRGPACAGGAS